MSPPHLSSANEETSCEEAAIVSRMREISGIIESNDAHPIFTLNHLAYEAGVSYGFIRSVVARRINPYRHYEMRKRRGGYRVISSPVPDLARVQRFILRKILSVQRDNPASYAYREGKSIKDCASRHIGSRWMIKMDIEDFFGSVNSKQVYFLFRDLGYSSLVSFELSRLVTWGCSPTAMNWQPYDYKISDYRHSIVGSLPQGAPTSGKIANLIARDLDKSLHGLAKTYGAIYTRYSDDIIFSFRRDITRPEARVIVKKSYDLMRANGFSPNLKKTAVIPPGARKIAVGLVVSDNVYLSREFKRRTERLVHGVYKEGVVPFSERAKFRSPIGLINYIEGSLAFAAHIDRKWAEGQQQKLLSSMRKNTKIR